MTNQLQQIFNLFKNSNGVSTDTRSLKEGQIFFAIKGPSFNGNKFAKEALEKNASAVVVDEEADLTDDRIIVVENSLTMLQRLANIYRREFNIPVIAIGGSNGKTTTKEITAFVLQEKFKTFFTKGNLNNHLGVPLTLLSMPAETEIAIIEIGANHLQETNHLCSIIEPTHGLITNNGKDHLEGYGSLEGVRKGNGELFEFLASNKGVAFISSLQNDLINTSLSIRSETFGESESDNIQGKILENFPFLKIEISNQIGSEIVHTKLYGDYNFENILAASCIGNHFGLVLPEIKNGIEKYKPANNRSQVEKIGTNTFILDAYNANPSSMMAALNSFEKLKSKNKIIVLGDMFELGSFSKAEHKLIYEKAKSLEVNLKIFVGNEFSKVVSETDTELCFANVDDAKRWYRKFAAEDYVFLFKASRGMELEKILQ